MLAVELPLGQLDRDVLGRAVARLLAVCDLLLADSVRWLWPGAEGAAGPPRERRGRSSSERYARGAR